MTRALRVLIVLALVAAAGWVTWRVLGPAEVVAAARDPYPAAVEHAPGPTGETAKAPLIVQGRIRVFAAKRQVSADAPVDAKTNNTPRWSYRRWPEQLSGVVAAGSMVVSRWSDGELVAIDDATGRIAWRAAGPAEGGYTGLGTGATTVWAPPGLATTGATVLATGRGQVTSYAAGTGAVRWRAACPDSLFTTAGGAVVCGSAVYDGTTGAALIDWPAGPLTPLDCGVAESACGGFRTAAGTTWITAPQARPIPVPGNAVGAGIGLTVSGGTVTTGSAELGTTAWRWSAPAGQDADLLGAGPGVLYLLTGGRDVVELDAATGTVRGAFRLALGTERTTWSPGRWQIADGYLAVERINNPDPASVSHYFSVATVIMAAL